MESAPLKIGIACFPLIGGSGILATALGSELARRGHEVYFFSYAQPVRLDLPQDNLHFHQVEFAARQTDRSAAAHNCFVEEPGASSFVHFSRRPF